MTPVEDGTTFDTPEDWIPDDGTPLVAKSDVADQDNASEPEPVSRLPDVEPLGIAVDWRDDTITMEDSAIEPVGTNHDDSPLDRLAVGPTVTEVVCQPPDAEDTAPDDDWEPEVDSRPPEDDPTEVGASAVELV